MSKRIGKSLVANGTTVVTEAAWNDELEEKHQKIGGVAARATFGRRSAFGAMRMLPGSPAARWNCAC